MKSAAFAFALSLLYKPHVYPLRLAILELHQYHHAREGYSGRGVANLEEEDGNVHEIDFTFDDCDQGFRVEGTRRRLLGRLKKAGVLEVAQPQNGSSNLTTCDFFYKP